MLGPLLLPGESEVVGGLAVYATGGGGVFTTVGVSVFGTS